MKNNKKGFTLVELLVVIAIIAILVVLILVALGVARQKARDSQRRTDLRSLETALELFVDDNNGLYPDALSELAPDYVPTVPTDPLNHDYDYEPSTDNKKYVLCVDIERAGSGQDDPYEVGTGVGDTTITCTPVAN